MVNVHYYFADKDSTEPLTCVSLRKCRKNHEKLTFTQAVDEVVQRRKREQDRKYYARPHLSSQYVQKDTQDSVSVMLHEDYSENEKARRLFHLSVFMKHLGYKGAVRVEDLGEGYTRHWFPTSSRGTGTGLNPLVYQNIISVEEMAKEAGY